MANIEIQGKLSASGEVDGIDFIPRGFGIDEATFRVGGAVVTLSIMELIELHSVCVRRSYRPRSDQVASNTTVP